MQYRCREEACFGIVHNIAAQNGVNANVFHLAIDSCIGDSATKTVDTCSGRARRSAHENGVFEIVPIDIAHTGCHFRGQAERIADADCSAAVCMFGAKIDGAEGLRDEATIKAAAHGVFFVKRRKKLIGGRAEFRIAFASGRFKVADFSQTVDMTFAKQIAAFDNFLYCLFVGNGLPLVFTALAGALEHLSDSSRISDAVGAR